MLGLNSRLLYRRQATCFAVRRQSRFGLLPLMVSKNETIRLVQLTIVVHEYMRQTLDRPW